MIALDTLYPDQNPVCPDCPGQNPKLCFSPKKWSWNPLTGQGSGRGKQNPATLLFLLLYILLSIVVIGNSKSMFYIESKNSKKASIELNFAPCPDPWTDAQIHIINTPHRAGELGSEIGKRRAA